MNTQTIAIIVSITGVGAVLLAAIVPLLVVLIMANAAALGAAG